MLDEKNLSLLHGGNWFPSCDSKSPVLKPDDLKGVRYRVSASLSSRYFAEAIGADLIPMGYGEIVQSLQTDLITAGDNSIALCVKTGKEQEAPNYTLTNLSWHVCHGSEKGMGKSHTGPTRNHRRINGQT